MYSIYVQLYAILPLTGRPATFSWDRKKFKYLGRAEAGAVITFVLIAGNVNTIAKHSLATNYNSQHPTLNI